MEIAAFTTIWVGLALFALLAGADFGVGFWVLASYLTDRGPELRRDAFGYFAPVWEINFLFLVFFMVGLIAAFPKGLGLLADVLDALILVALILFVFRSASYALLHHGPRPTRGPATLVFAVSSVVAGMIELAARNGDWKAAAWRLEPMFFERYGPRAKVDHGGETKVKHELPQIHDDRETVIEILKETGGLEAVMAWTDSLDPRKA